MPTRTFTRKTAPDGTLADPSKGQPSFLSGVYTALSGRTWRSAASDTEVVLDIDGVELTGQEDTEVNDAYNNWIPVDFVPSILRTEDTDTNEVAHTGAVYPGVAHVSFTTPGLEAGTFHIQWKAQLMTDTSSKQAWVKVEVDGVLIDEDSTMSTVWTLVSGFADLTFDSPGTHTISAHLKSEAGNASAHLKNFRYSVWRIA